MKNLILILVAVLMLVGCFETIYEGDVVDKHYEQARSWTTVYYQKVGSMRIPVVQNHYDDPDWVFVIQGPNEKGDKLLERRLEVNETFWNEHRLGDHIVLPRPE
jgi:hypothetical protein